MEEDFSYEYDIYEIGLALQIDLPLKPTDENSATIKKLYEDWNHFNKCCMMMMENCMDEAVFTSIPNVDTSKGLLEEIGKKFNNTKYDGVKRVRDHIMLLSSYYNKFKGRKDNTHHMGKRKEYLNGRSSYCKKIGHKKVDCWKLKGKQEKKGDDKSKGTNQP